MFIIIHSAMDKLAEGLSPSDLRGFDPIRKKEVLQEICKLDGFVGKQVKEYYRVFIDIEYEV